MCNNEISCLENKYNQDSFADISQESFSFFEFFFCDNGTPVLIAR